MNDSYTISFLESGHSEQVIFDWTPTFGYYTVTINVSILGVTEEFYIDNEKNSFVVAGSEIVVSDLNTPDYTYLASVEDINARITNLGASTETVTAYLVVDGSDVDSQVFSLDSSDNDIVSFTWTATSGGTYPVGIRAEIASTEPFTGNNVLTQDVIVFNDIVDQEQDIGTYPFTIYASRWAAQAFVPTVNSLPRAELLMHKLGSPSNDVTVSIRSSLSGADLGSFSVPASEIGDTPTWVIFAFANVDLTPGNTYYLVMHTC